MRRDRESDDVYILDSGKMFYANNGIIGLGHDFGWIHNGYDDSDSIRTEPDDAWSRLEPHEAVEIAEHMIAKWSKFRDHWKAKV